MENCLKAWGGYDFMVNIDERTDEIELEIKYEDHGDEFLLIKTKQGEIFVYGYFENRIDYFENDESLVRKTELFCRKVDGFDGICGKRIVKHGIVYCDKIIYAKKNGKRKWIKTHREFEDLYGYATYSFEA